MTFIQLLKDQSGQFWGGFLGGLNQGIRQNQERADKREHLALQKKMLEAQIKQMDIGVKLKEREAAGKEGLAQQFELPSKDATFDWEKGDSVPGVDPQGRLKAAMVRAGLGREAVAPQPKSALDQLNEMLTFQDQAQQVMQKRAGPPVAPVGQPQGGSMVDPGQQPRTLPGFGGPQASIPSLKFNSKGQPVLSPASPERSPIGETSVLFKRYSDARKAEGWSDDRIREGWTQERAKIPAAGAKGVEEAKLEVRSGEPFLANKQEQARRTAQGTAQVSAQKRLSESAGTEAIVGQIADLSQRVNTLRPGAGRFIGGAMKHAGAFAQTDLDAADLKNMRDAYSTSLSRSVLAERGVLTDQDRKVATSAIPDLMDSKEMAQRKIARLKSLTGLQIWAEEQLASGAQFNMEEFRQKWRLISKPNIEGSTEPKGGPQGRLVPLGPR